MYLFYIDESGQRDKVLFTNGGNTPNHIYVLTAVGLYENDWNKFDQEISRLKIDIIKRNNLKLELSDCEVKSSLFRSPNARKSSPFFSKINQEDIDKLQTGFYNQLDSVKAVLISVVIDKRVLDKNTSPVEMHQKAYEFLLERIRNHMKFNHPRHKAIIIMDDTGKNLNRNIAMLHAKFQREGSEIMKFGNIIEYPLFTASELSNGIQLADLCAYNVFRAFVRENFTYTFFENQLKYYPKLQTSGEIIIKVWPDQSALIEKFNAYLEETMPERYNKLLKELTNRFNKNKG